MKRTKWSNFALILMYPFDCWYLNARQYLALSPDRVIAFRCKLHSRLSNYTRRRVALLIQLLPNSNNVMCVNNKFVLSSGSASSIQSIDYFIHSANTHTDTNIARLCCAVVSAISLKLEHSQIKNEYIACVFVKNPRGKHENWLICSLSLCLARVAGKFKRRQVNKICFFVDLFVCSNNLYVFSLLKANEMRVRFVWVLFFVGNKF